MKTSWTISVFTATRAEYHLLTPVIRGIWNDDSLQLDLIVSGTHLCEKYGRTIEDIYADGFPVADTIETIQDGNSVDDIIALTLIGCSKHFKKIHPDFYGNLYKNNKTNFFLAKRLAFFSKFCHTISSTHFYRKMVKCGNMKFCRRNKESWIKL